MSPGKGEIQWARGGADRIRTDDLLLAKQALFQLSYGPGFQEAKGQAQGRFLPP